MKNIRLTKVEHALLAGLLFAPSTEVIETPLSLTDEDRDEAATLLRRFVGQLTCKLLGEPVDELSF